MIVVAALLRPRAGPFMEAGFKLPAFSTSVSGAPRGPTKLHQAIACQQGCPPENQGGVTSLYPPSYCSFTTPSRRRAVAKPSSHWTVSLEAESSADDLPNHRLRTLTMSDDAVPVSLKTLPAGISPGSPLGQRAPWSWRNPCPDLAGRSAIGVALRNGGYGLEVQEAGGMWTCHFSA
ncbi:unnamed protein product [Lota lota]